jgi:ribosome-associated translation inhibitor RaiA
VRVIGVELDEEDRALIRQKLGRRLGKFVSSIERVTVRVTDVNGPRGGVDHACNVKVVLSGLPSVVVERKDAAPHAAIDLALRATEQAVRRTVGRRRMKPLRRGPQRPA